MITYHVMLCLVVNYYLHLCQCTRQKQRGFTPAVGYCSSLRTLLTHIAREARRRYGSTVEFSALTGHTGIHHRTDLSIYPVKLTVLPL